MIIDSHIHFYDPERPQGIPFPRKDDALLYRKVLPEHFQKVTGPSGVTHAVVVEASRSMDDNLWVIDLAYRNELILGFIAGLDPKSSSFREQLRQLSAFPILRGIRLRQDELKNLSPLVLDNLELVRDLRLSVDVLAKGDDKDVLLKLADRYPDLPIIVNHICQLKIDGRAPTRDQRSLLSELGSRPTVYCKVSAIQEYSVGAADINNREHYRLMQDCLWQCFGADRLIFGSNWPVCERAADYASQFNIVSDYFAEKGDAASRKFLSENAQQAYGLYENKAKHSLGLQTAL